VNNRLATPRLARSTDRPWPGGAWSWKFRLVYGILALTGCAKSSLPTIPVEGTVTWNGTALADAQIAFQPVAAGGKGSARPAVGRIDDRGQYFVSTFANGDGAMPGEYTVVVVGRRDHKPVEVLTKADHDAMASPIPAIYSDASRSPLKASIPAGAKGPLRFDFKLEGR
jgi:hypothetical protein